MLEWTGNVHFNTICEITFLVHVGGRIFCINPAINSAGATLVVPHGVTL